LDRPLLQCVGSFLDRKDALEALPDLGSLSDDELKELIEDLMQQETEVSYQRRILHGKIDILRAEYQARLKGRGGISDVTVEKLTDILTGKAAPSSPEDGQ
jgi:hypothetical protein